MIIDYLPLIQSVIRQYDIEDEKSVHDILTGIISELLEHESDLKKLTNKDFCTVYILYTTKGVVQRYQNESSPKRHTPKKEYGNLHSIFSQFSQSELDIIIYKEFMGYSNYKIAKTMGISQQELNSQIHGLEMKLAKTIVEEIENEELL